MLLSLRKNGPTSLFKEVRVFEVLDTPGVEAWEVLFETFWEFRGSGVWRLLFLGIAIVRQVP